MSDAMELQTGAALSEPAVGLITPVILSGGSGARLWPYSREAYPKQFLALSGQRSLLQETALRVCDAAIFGAPVLICNAEHRFILAEQIQATGIAPAAIMLEPAGRNTAPAIAVAALHVAADDPEALLLILPADHVVGDGTAFQVAVARAARAARAGYLVTFGIEPTAPETGYGYIRPGPELSPGIHSVSSFLEKPSRPVAEACVEDGDHLWNSGMFLCTAAVLLAELERHAPEVVRSASAALEAARQDLDFLRLGPAFSEAPAISFDHAVLEWTERAVVVPVAMDWADLGCWPALWQKAPKDPDGNAAVGDVMLLDSAGCYAHAPTVLTALVGVRDLVVVVTDDAVLVADRNQPLAIRTLVDRLKAAARPEAMEHKRVYRPWGYYQGVHAGDGFQVKRISVYPGRQLSLQKHFHRSEHWVIVQGQAIATVGDRLVPLSANESIYIPKEAIHRLENPGPEELCLIEVQTGDYLGEDDIVRLEDRYGRL